MRTTLVLACVRWKKRRTVVKSNNARDYAIASVVISAIGLIAIYGTVSLVEWRSPGWFQTPWISGMAYHQIGMLAGIIVGAIWLVTGYQIIKRWLHPLGLAGGLALIWFGFKLISIGVGLIAKSIWFHPWAPPLSSAITLLIIGLAIIIQPYLSRQSSPKGPIPPPPRSHQSHWLDKN